MPILREGRIEDAFYVSTRLRDADKKECRLAVPDTYPSQVVINSFNASTETFCVLSEGKPCLIGGACETSDDSAVIWALGTPSSVQKNNVRAWLEMSPAVLRQLCENYGDLWNYVWKGNLRHLSWLARMGAEFEQGVDPDFYKFTIKRSLYV